MRANFVYKNVKFIKCENCGNDRSYWLAEDFEEDKFFFKCIQCQQDWRGEIQKGGIINIFPAENSKSQLVLVEVKEPWSPIILIADREETDEEAAKRKMGRPDKRYRLSRKFHLKTVETKVGQGQLPMKQLKAAID
jgi:hypothetical protein